MGIITKKHNTPTHKQQMLLTNVEEYGRDPSQQGKNLQIVCTWCGASELFLS